MSQFQLHFKFNCGTVTATVVSANTYNDTAWHTATIARTGGRGKLVVDAERAGEASVECAAPAPLAPPHYYGGLPLLTETIADHLEVTRLCN